MARQRNGWPALQLIFKQIVKEKNKTYADFIKSGMSATVYIVEILD